MNDNEAAPSFDLTVDVDKSSNDNTLVLNIATNYISGPDGDTSNMAIVEVSLPTGFTVDLQATINASSTVKGYKKAETKKGGTIVVIYLDNISTTPVNLRVTAYRICQVAGEKPVPVRVQDYYRTGKGSQIATVSVIAILKSKIHFYFQNATKLLTTHVLRRLSAPSVTLLNVKLNVPNR